MFLCAFLSITQVVSDGLIILFLLVNYLFIQWIVFSFEVDLNIEKSLSDSLGFKAILFLFITFIFVFIVYKILNKKSFTTIDLTIIVYTALLFLKALRNLLVYWFGQELKKKYLLIIIISCFPLIIINLSNITSVFHKLFHSPSNFKNIEYLECYLDKNKKDFELMYFNDKYIFIKHVKGKQIEIVNFEVILNKNNCK